MLDIDYKDNNPGVKIFPYMAYTPLIPKIVELLLDGEWQESNTLNKIGYPGYIGGKYNHLMNLNLNLIGNSSDIIQSVKNFKKLSQQNNDKGSKIKIFNRPVVIVYVLGGLTYAEISSLRHISEVRGIELLICVTKVINYRDMIECFDG